MIKRAGIEGDPAMVCWAKPRLISQGGTPASQRMRTHPYWTRLCKVRENSATTTQDQPDNPSDATGLSVAEHVGLRIAEHVEDEVGLGADPSILGFFIQNLGAGSGGGNGTTPALFRGPDDADGIATEAQNFNAIRATRSTEGPLTIDSTRVPCAVASAAYRDELKAQLIARDLDPPGWWDGDTEQLHEPWHWCRSSGGTWAANVAAADAGTVAVVKAAHGGPGMPESDLSLLDWIAQAEARTPTFDPIHTESWNSAANIASGSTREMMGGRADFSQSQYAAITADLWHEDPYWEDLIVGNYAMVLNNDRRFPAHSEANGAAFSDHNADYFGMGYNAPVLYPYNNSDGTIREDFRRFSPNLGFYPGGYYDRVQLAGITRRLMASAEAGSGGLPTCPWIRGIDARIGPERSPALAIEDFVFQVRMLRTYKSVRRIIVWVDDSTFSNVNWEAMEIASMILWPHIVWNQSLGDWVEI